MSLNGIYDTDNIFAKIVRGEMPCVKVFEDEDTLAFMDVFPQSKGHMLVIPKKESARNLLDVNPDALAPILKTVQRVAHAMKTALSPDGIIITQFNGAPAGQTVFHLHFHIIPRYDNTGLGQHASGGMADMDELNAIAARIQSAL
ncbi:MAG: HIT family protein [Robiginitomaculum sp.]|nr:MAG: HIT family protein [Robiginitomaculum sp.]